MTNLAPLKAAIKLIADAGNDVVKSLSDTTAAAKLAEFQNLITDLMTLVPQIGQISLSGLAPADYAALLAELAVDLAIPQAHTAAIVNTSIKLLEDIATVIYPDVTALIAAIQAGPVAAPAVASPVVPPAPATPAAA